jgi:aliphatic sulfonates family ABC transporter substrate-binding protein
MMANWGIRTMKSVHNSLRFAAVTCVAVAGLFTSTAWGQGSLPIRIGWQPSGEFRYFVAQELKLFEKAGLRPEYIKFVAGPPTLAALKSGDIDVSFLGSAPAIAGLAQGIDYKIIMPSNEGLTLSALVARPDSGIRTLKDIKGKKIASAKGASTYMAVLKALDLQKLTLQDIEFVDLPVPSMIPAFANKSVDAIWVWSPWSSKLEAEGGKIVAGMKDVQIDWAQQLWVARTEWLEKQPEAARRLVQAIDFASQALKSNPAPAVKAVATQLAIPPAMAREILATDHYPSLEEMVSQNYRSSLTAPQGYAQGLQEQAEFMHKQNFIKSLPDVKSAIDPRPVQNYLKSR